MHHASASYIHAHTRTKELDAHEGFSAAIVVSYDNPIPSQPKAHLSSAFLGGEHSKMKFD